MGWDGEGDRGGGKEERCVVDRESRVDTYYYLPLVRRGRSQSQSVSHALLDPSKGETCKRVLHSHNNSPNCKM